MNTKLIEKIVWAFGGGVGRAAFGSQHRRSVHNHSAERARGRCIQNQSFHRQSLVDQDLRQAHGGRPIGVISARQAEVEKTRDLSEEDAQALVVGHAAVPTTGSGHR